MFRRIGRIVCMTFLFLGIKSTIPTDPPPSSSCQECKSVSGSGPLAGEYFLVEGENQESLCLNHCVYMKKDDDGDDRYCFIKQDGPYTTNDCEMVLHSTVAPFMKIIRNMIEENGEIIEQVDQYNNVTGEVSIEVPPHGNREPLQILMDPNKDTIVSSTLSKCQIKSLPDEVDPRSLGDSKDEVDSSDEAITGNNEVIRYGITLERGEASQEDLYNLSSSAKTACEGKKIVLTEEKSVNGEVFKNLTNGGIIDLGPNKHRRKRDLHDGNCSEITRLCGERTDGCWRWTHGIHFSIHHLNLDLLCVECCSDGDSTSQLCQCSSITTLQRLEECTKPDNGSCPDGFYSCEGQCKVEVGSPTAKCNGLCPNSRVSCGDLCIPSAWNSKLYDHYKQWNDCNGQCIHGNTPCNGSCPVGKAACGDQCVLDEHVSRWYRLCDGVCITTNMPCNGTCNDGRVVCGDQCITDNKSWRDCNGKCIYKTQACEGMCPLERYLCGNSSRCITNVDTSFKVCNGKCIYYNYPCNGECPDRKLLLENGPESEYDEGYGEYQGKAYCTWDDDSTYMCGNSRISRFKKCNGSCSNGWIPCDKDYLYNYNFNYDELWYVQCVLNGSRYRDCNGTCTDIYYPCEGECPIGTHICDGNCLKDDYACNNKCQAGWELCGRWYCIKNNSLDNVFRSCGEKCVRQYETCDGQCASGMNVCGSRNCYTQDSVYQPCNGMCLTNGTSCEGSCKTGFLPCTLGYTYYDNEQVCYNDSEQSLFYLFNGYCWFKNRDMI